MSEVFNVDVFDEVIYESRENADKLTLMEISKLQREGWTMEIGDKIAIFYR